MNLPCPYKPLSNNKQLYKNRNPYTQVSSNISSIDILIKKLIIGTKIKHFVFFRKRVTVYHTITKIK